MTALDVIGGVDGKLHNVFPLADKLEWLNQAESMVLQLLGRVGMPREAASVEAETVLTAPKPYDRLYAYYLEAQIHYANQEYLKFNNAMALFQAVWMEYANALQRGDGRPGRRKFF